MTTAAQNKAGIRKRKGTGKTQSFLSLLLVVVNLLAFNFLAGRHFLRWDLTESGVYTLSTDTQQVLSSLDDLITVKCYFTRDLPAGGGEYREELEDLLEEFRVAANGRLQIFFLDPSADPEVRKEAEHLNIQELRLEQAGSDRFEVKQAYLGLTVQYEGRIEVLPVANPGILEYELLMRIVRVKERSPPTIAFNQQAQALPRDLPPELKALEGSKPKKDRHDIAGDYKGIVESLGLRYAVEAVSLEQRIPHHVDTLVVANQENLDPVALYHIDQFLMRGGKLALLWPGIDVLYNPLKGKSRDGRLDEWLAHYGIEVEKAVLMDPKCAHVRFDSAGGYQFNAFPASPRITESQIEPDHPITRGIRDMVIPFCSPITLAPKEGATARVLVKSSPKAWQEEGSFSLEPDRIRMPDGQERRTFDLVGLIEGEFLSFFAARPVPEQIKSDPQKEGKRLRSSDTAIFVIGSSDFIGNPFQMVKQHLYYAALLFFMNAADYLTTGEAFANIRTRDWGVRYIDEEYLKNPETFSAIKMAGVFTGAAIAGLIGIVLWAIRRARRGREVRWS
ncbi:MAG: GldG family protein [Planctomycetota bacterium]|jgi:ABC-type uncharacterized transport system involved in gliding motility auxiliary subunit